MMDSTTLMRLAELALVELVFLMFFTILLVLKRFGKD